MDSEEISDQNFGKGTSSYILGNGIGALTCLSSVKLKDPKFYEANFRVPLKIDIPQGTMKSYNEMIKNDSKILVTEKEIRYLTCDLVEEKEIGSIDYNWDD